MSADVLPWRRASLDDNACTRKPWLPTRARVACSRLTSTPTLCTSNCVWVSVAGGAGAQCYTISYEDMCGRFGHSTCCRRLPNTAPLRHSAAALLGLRPWQPKAGAAPGARPRVPCHPRTSIPPHVVLSRHLLNMARARMRVYARACDEAQPAFKLTHAAAHRGSDGQARRKSATASCGRWRRCAP